MYDTTKSLLTKLRPKTLDDLNLTDAVEQLVREMEFDVQGVDIRFDWQGDIHTLSDTLNVTLFRLCQESLNNACKYAHATRIQIRLEVYEHVKLTIADNGVGFKLEECMKGMGLRGMKERVQALGGRFQLQSIHEQYRGTRIDIQLPVL